MTLRHGASPRDSAVANDLDAGSVRDAVAVVRATAGSVSPRIGLVLGSGLGGLADDIDSAHRIPYARIPGFRGATVVGHHGALVMGRLGGVEVTALAGRVHMYEGWSAEEAAFPVRVLHALGARTLFVSNAAGAINRLFRPGDLMAIDDHINLMWTNPLSGPVADGDPRFPDMSEPYDRELRRRLHDAARRAGVALVDGTYAGLLGPTYETPAEVRMLERLGVDAAGMSTVPETIVARALGMRVAGISLISNAASGSPGAGTLSHADVLKVAAEAGGRFRRLIQEWLADV
jgi:purine-nucleoside phosphorylase